MMFLGFSIYITDSPNGKGIEDVFLNNRIKWLLEEKEIEEKLVVYNKKPDFIKEDKITYIEIKDLKFNPKEINITVGTKVVWQNNDYNGRIERPHMIVAHYNKFRSERISYEDSFSFTFTEPGTYKYLDPIYKSDAGGLIMGVGVVNVV